MILAGVVVFVKTFMIYELDARSFSAKSLKMVEDRIGLTLPAGSRGLNMFYDHFHCIDPYFVAKIEIPASSHEAFTKQLEPIPEKWQLKDSAQIQLSKKVAWWNPSEATIRRQRWSMPNGNGVWVLLCEENGRWILYVSWVCV